MIAEILNVSCQPNCDKL